MARLGKMPTSRGRRRSVNLKETELVRSRPLFEDRKLPLLVEPGMENVSLKEWAADHREQIDAWLYEYSGILFRGFNIQNPEAFYQVVEATAGSVLTYQERSSPRHEVAPKVYTSTDYPKDQPIFLHNENSYQSAWPLKLFFYCHVQPGHRGETPLADCRRIWSKLDPAIRQKFQDKGIMYVRNFSKWSNVKWQTVFGTEDRDEVEAYCKTKGMRAIWKDEGNGLRTEAVRPLTFKHPKTGDETWFNHATFFHITTLHEKVRKTIEANFNEEDLPTNSYYGDGSSIEPETLDALRSLYADEKILFPWRQGDILLIDNMYAAHGREPFEGNRTILVAMAEGFVPTAESV